MKRLLCLGLVLLAAGCGRAGDREAGETVEPVETPAPLVQTTTITGLYESGPEAQRSQLCIVEDGTGVARFGLVLRTAGGNCSGAGTAERREAVLRLAMAGDSACPIEAATAGARVDFPRSLPSGCAYYCAPGAAMTGARFDKTGGTRDDAMRARDLVGDPLCPALPDG